jgi:hypothetical protein
MGLDFKPEVPAISLVVLFPFKRENIIRPEANFSDRALDFNPHASKETTFPSTQRFEGKDQAL